MTSMNMTTPASARNLFPPLTRATFATSLLAGLAADFTWEIWARVITPHLPGIDGPLEPAALVESAGRLVEDESAIVSKEDVARARALLRDVGKGVRDRASRADIREVSAVLGKMAGRSSREAIELLMRTTDAG